MSGRLWGDLLRILAHGGVNVGSHVLGEALTLPFKEKAMAKRAAVGELVKSMPFAPQEAMPAIAGKIKELSGVDWPTYQGESGNVIGPEGEKLAMTPVAGAPVSKEMVTKYVQPPPDMGHVLGMMAKQNPEMAMRMLGAKAGDVTPAIEAKLAEVARGHDIRQYLGELADTTRNQIAEMRDATNKELTQMRLDQMKTNHERALNEKIREFEVNKEKGIAKSEDEAANKIQVKMRDLYTRIFPNDAKKKVKPEQQYELVQEYNNYIRTGKELYPKSFREFSEIPAIKEPGMLYGHNYKIGTAAAPKALAETPKETPAGSSDVVSQLIQRAKSGDKTAQEWLKKQGKSWE